MDKSRALDNELVIKAVNEIFDVGYAQGVDDTKQSLSDALAQIGINIDAWLVASKKIKQETNNPALQELWIDILDLSERPRNCLNRVHSDKTAGYILSLDPSDLLAITNFGQLSLDEVATKIHDLGVVLPKEWQRVYNMRDKRFWP
jgi:DNA-directed RNA polymerase alpha subunit